MKMYLMYSTQPQLRCLGLEKDPQDCQNKIEQNLSVAQARTQAARERAEKVGGEIPTVGITRWSNVKIAEVEIEFDERIVYAPKA